MTAQSPWRDEAAVVIVGGGVIGSSIAYHLCVAGVTDVLVLERNELSSGATARSAGLLSHARSDRNVTRMISRTRRTIGELEERIGEPLDFRHVGVIRAVHSSEREQEMLAMEACLVAEGIEPEPIDRHVARSLCPWLDLAEASRIIFVPSDGYIDGARLGTAYARAARTLGARMRRGVDVTGAIIQDGMPVGVDTSLGAIRCGTLVQACGAWSVQFAETVGFAFPAAPTRSHYWMTAPDGNGAPERPNVQLPDFRAYFRSEVGGLLVGLQEPRSRTYDPQEIGSDMEEAPLYEEGNDMELLLAQAGALRPAVPQVDEWRFAHHIAGLSMYTPDGKFVLGRVESVPNFLVAGGCCGSGVAASGGIGHTIAALATGGEPEIDLGPFRAGRFGSVDPRSETFRERCSAARSGKSRGRPDPVGVRE